MKKKSLNDLNRLDVISYRQSKKLPVVVICDNIRSMNNVGSIFRSCDAFRIDQLLLCGITAIPPHRDIHKAALGATDSVAWKYFEETREALEYSKALGYKLWGVEQTHDSISLQNYLPDKESKAAFVIGNEVKGLTDAILPLLDGVLEIPQWGSKHSLNVSISLGIVLWHHYMKADFCNLLDSEPYKTEKLKYK